MKEESRTKNSLRNAFIATIAKVIIFLVQFICRTIFIKLLDVEYLGVNGLFANILVMLSFAELGIGNAIIFKLYKPIAEHDEEKIKTYMNFYKKTYRIIGFTMLAIGCIIIPFLKYIIQDAPNIKENLSYIYILFLANSVISYFFVYKRSIITGHQKEYIVTIIEFIMIVTQNIAQIIVLLVLHNYIAYLIVQIICTILTNGVCAIVADKLYPFIKDKNYKKITKSEEKSIFKDVKSLVLYKLGYMISNGTDNMIISAFVGVSQVGILSNYTTIVNAIASFLSSFFNGFTASVGNLNTKGENSKKEGIYYQLILLLLFMYGIISVGMIILINDFISMWIGKEYLLSFSVCFILGLNEYVNGMRFANYTFRNTAGLFKKGKWIPLIASIVNIILSIILVQYTGIFGVIFATAITRMLISTMYDPYLIHKYIFKTPCIRFYKTYIYYFILFLISVITCRYITMNINITFKLLEFIIKGIITVLTTLIIFLIGTFKTDEFKQLLQKMKPKTSK